MAKGYRLCPCGSGLPYKACCGGKEQSEQEAVSRNRAAAYAGRTGSLREAFCREYTGHKQSAIKSIAGGLRQEAKANGKEIYCAKGCPWCCDV